MHKKAFALFLLAACGTTPLPAGAVCKATLDCEAELSCLDLGQFNGTACTVIGKSCTKTCTDDAGCASLGTNFKCFATCSTDKVCALVAQ